MAIVSCQHCSPLSIILATCVSVAMPLIVSAQNVFFLDNSPIQAMTDDEVTLLEQSAYRTLDTTPDGQALSWKSKVSDTGGTITPVATWEESGRPCRTLQFDHQAKGRIGRPRLDFCKQADGSWKIANQPR
jgi:surface antigen